MRGPNASLLTYLLDTTCHAHALRRQMVSHVIRARFSATNKILRKKLHKMLEVPVRKLRMCNFCDRNTRRITWKERKGTRNQANALP